MTQGAAPGGACAPPETFNLERESGSEPKVRDGANAPSRGSYGDACPRCGAPLRPRTTLELDRAPPDLSLATLGLAPREVLAVRTAEGWDWVELEHG
ncbi:hypothetical protein [uncultured Thiodictyon sp.]|jgi:hypothetical protein|uniref:hypothetical protein n=1 Tax=uncultured Thiodictyon sp. TaxID=1846217 RepID=UPI0025FDDF4B|nr:hypothetical protein [uncultured Thiodictyon sp.]